MAEVTLEFLGLQMSRLLERQERLQDDTTVLIGMMQRLDGAVLGLTTEVGARHSRYDRLRPDVDRLRERGPQAPA